MLKAILFDLDDTLIDWGYFLDNWEEVEDLHLPGVFEHICTLGTPTGDLSAFKKEYLQRTKQAWTNARETLVAPHLGRILVQTAVALGIAQDSMDERACLEAYRWAKVEGTVVFPDVVEGLKLLRNAGLRFGLVTNAFQPMWLREIEMEAHGLLDFFPECRFSAADVGYLKPHPDIFAEALKCLDVKPDEAIFIGDNPTADIAGAQSAGMKAVMRINPGMKPMLSGLIVPDAAINNLLELPSVLDQWFPGWAGG
ncbi:MAG: HAD family hydrolase [Anaerolineae bacterium]